VVPRYFHRFGIFRRQHLVIIDVVSGLVVASKKTACYFQPETFLNGRLIVTVEPPSDAESIEWHIPEALDQFDLVKDVSWC
ncbi:MAG: hypothetical protein GQ563_06985, partial [Desulfuromusa sp.]|nr:hypothetical protein [Desulfuromusa sp.]